MSKIIKIGTRGSALALYQAEKTKAMLEDLGEKAEIVIIKTKGDAIQHLSFDKIEGKGFFTKEIEDALYNNDIDIAIHSCKDLETQDPEGLIIASIFDRTMAEDAIIFKKDVWGKIQNGDALKLCFGTSSARRKSQLLRLYPGAVFKDIRGNVPTRLKKLSDDEALDAIVLAKAGFTRLGLDVSQFHCEIPSINTFVPAAAQGALAIQCREVDVELIKVLDNINEAETAAIVKAERKLLSIFGGGCQKPTAIHINKVNDAYKCYISHSDSADFSGALFQFELEDLSENALKGVAEKVKKKIY